jgi:hypothetical protein
MVAVPVLADVDADELLKHWLTPQRRRELKRAGMRGEAVRDPIEAALVVYQARREQRVIRWWFLLAPVLSLGQLALAVSGEAVNWFSVALAAMWALFLLAYVLMWRLYGRAVARNAAVADVPRAAALARSSRRKCAGAAGR